VKAVQLDKIASVTLNCGLRKDVRVSDEFQCREGDVIAVRVLNSKTTYNTLELPSGRMSTVRKGDIVAGALGHRQALLGYAGRLPESLRVGDTLNLLNIGGVLGVCTSASPAVGEPFECEVLGQVLSFPQVGSRKSVPANIAADCDSLDDRVDALGAPVIAVVGTCMNSGKTEACLALVHEFARRGMKVAAAKATGVSLRRDVLAMEDAGAASIGIFTDLGVVTTSRANAAGLARTLLNRLAKGHPDVILVELGDGILGDYGVDAILADKGLSKSFAATVLAANDPVAAWGGVELLVGRFGIFPTVITGPATDNEAGRVAVTRETKVAAINARSSREELAAQLKSKLEPVHA
jgi:hypothetical protein